MKALEARWIGWAGVNVPDEIGQKALTKALAEKVLQFLHYDVWNFWHLHLCFSSVISNILSLIFLLLVTCGAEVYPSIS